MHRFSASRTVLELGKWRREEGGRRASGRSERGWQGGELGWQGGELGREGKGAKREGRGQDLEGGREQARSCSCALFIPADQNHQT